MDGGGSGVFVAFTPKGGCPLKQRLLTLPRPVSQRSVAFTPKGGCPLKPVAFVLESERPIIRSIHPQGWVPVETASSAHALLRVSPCSIHPQGWVPVETSLEFVTSCTSSSYVAFTPKGGCPLKHTGRGF